MTGKQRARAREPSGYWIWQPHSTERGKAFVTEMSGLDSKQHVKMLRGERLVPLPKLVIQDTTQGHFPDHLGNYMGIMLVAPVLRQVLEKFPGAHLQFIPVSVRGQPNLKYSAVNVLDTIPALDLDKSKVTRLPGVTAIDRILRFRLRPIVADAPPTFHVAESPTLVMVSHDLQRQLAAASKTPGRLTPAEKFRNEF